MVNPKERRVPLTGYSHQLSARPGDILYFKLSATGYNQESPATVRSWLTKSICADPNPAGPGIVEHDASEWYSGDTHKVVEQAINTGSSASSTPIPMYQGTTQVSLQLTLWPTRCNGDRQSLISFGALEIFLGSNNTLECQLGNEIWNKAGNRIINVPVELQERHWYKATAAVFDNANDVELHLTLNCLPDAFAGDSTSAASEHSVNVVIKNVQLTDLFGPNGDLDLAARPMGETFVDHFNGKLEAPELCTYGQNDNGSKRVLRYAWDFSEQMERCRIDDEDGHDVALDLINLPARAMKSSGWTGEEMCWRHKPEHYAAIHFHDDDLVDMEWHNTFGFELPGTMPSGVYVMRISDGINEDAMPFFVCAPIGKTANKLCVLVSTFTYAIYGNHARPNWAPEWKDKMEQFNAYPYNPAEYPGYGLSTYNYHSDGSGICHASHRRPLFNLRPGYITFGNTSCSGLRHFQADSHLLAWLDAKGIGFDIITDRELHNEGASSIEDYDVLLTGSHPEYHTAETLNALTTYRDNGGHLNYLGGNGFYWRIAIHSELQHALEIRRAEAGIRAWAAEVGEYYQAFDGHYGGLWRRNGRPPQALCGLGFSAQGEFNGSYYRRTNFEPEYAWIFDGVDDELIGNFGLSGEGAAGFELDRADARLGTPSQAVVLASSEAHSEDFILVPEEMLTHLTTLPGPKADELIRADIIWCEFANGGSVFSVGSITFCGSLPNNNFDNCVSRLLHNIVERCLTNN